MTHAFKLAALGVAITLGAVATGSSGNAEAREGHYGAHHGDRPSFEMLDTNADGQLTRAELEAHRTARFTAADSNGDGMLSVEELQAQGAERAAKRAVRMMEHLDANSDGQLTQEEMAQGRRGGGMERMFGRVDADEDGVISKAEFDTAREKAGKHRKN